MRKAIVRYVLAIVFLFLASMFFSWFIQFRYFGSDFNRTIEFFFGKPGVFWYSTLLIFLILTFFSAIARRPFVVVGVIMAILIIMTFSNTNKLAFRNEPVVPEDLLLVGQAGALTKFITREALARTFLAAGFSVILGFLLNHLIRKVFPLECQKDKNLSWSEKYNLPVRGIIILLSTIGFLISLDPLLAKSEGLGNLGITFTPWAQKDNYDNNGFVISFLSNLSKASLKVPENYDTSSLAALEEKCEYEESVDKTKRSTLKGNIDNMIIVLSESFYDPAIIKEYYPYSGGDPTPFFHSLANKYPSGYMYSPEYGGGTGNVEYEVLTGLTNYWTQSTPMSDVVPRLTKLDSVMTYAKKNNFETATVHPFTFDWYSRNISLPILGVDKLTFIDDFRYILREPESGYINDWSSFREALDLIEKKNEPQMIELITMQNHVPYDSAKYATLDFKLEGSGDKVIESYLQDLNRTDKYLEALITSLDNFNERTVVLWYGDHAPSLFPEMADGNDWEAKYKAHLVPYFIYANFKISELNKNYEKDLPTTTPNCLINTLYDTLGLEKPSYYYLIGEVCEETPILSRGYFGDNTPEETETLKSYQTLNYALTSSEN